MLLDITPSNDVSFPLMQVITICTLVVSVTSTILWVKFKVGQLETDLLNHKIQDKLDKLELEATIEKNELKSEKEKKDFFEKYQEYKVHSSNGRKAEKKELMELIEKSVKTAHDRIDSFKQENNKDYDKLEKRIDRMEIKMSDNTKEILDAINKKRT